MKESLKMLEDSIARDRAREAAGWLLVAVEGVKLLYAVLSPRKEVVGDKDVIDMPIKPRKRLGGKKK